jgi:hypothetical protein
LAEFSPSAYMTDIQLSRVTRIPSNHVECCLITGLGHMHFVPRPGDTPFIAEVRVGGIG